MPHTHYGKFKSGVQEVKEGLPLARKGLKGFFRRKRTPLEERDKQEIRDMQNKFRHQMRGKAIESEHNFQQQVQAIKKKIK